MLFKKITFYVRLSQISLLTLCKKSFQLIVYLLMFLILILTFHFIIAKVLPKVECKLINPYVRKNSQK